MNYSVLAFGTSILVEIMSGARPISLPELRVLGDLIPLPIIRVAAEDPIALPVQQLEGPVGAPIDLKISLPSEEVRFALFQGMPQYIKLSRGIPLNKNWLVTGADINRLVLISTQRAPEPIVLEVLFFKDIKQKPIARRFILLKLTERVPGGGILTSTEPAQIAETTLSGAVDTQPTQNAVQIPKISVDQEEGDLERARDLLKNGDVSSARRILEFLVALGSAKGARLLGETYDPIYLNSIAIAGMQPDIELAKKWYSRAVELGDSQSQQRLTALK